MGVRPPTARRSRWRACSRGRAWHAPARPPATRSARTCCSRWSAGAASPRLSRRSTWATACGPASWPTWPTITGDFRKDVHAGPNYWQDGYHELTWLMRPTLQVQLADVVALSHGRCCCLFAGGC